MKITGQGILFKGEMIVPLLNTKPDVWPAEPIDPSKPFKWQTRRVIDEYPITNPVSADHVYGKTWEWVPQNDAIHRPKFKCPYDLGGVLWAKENYFPAYKHQEQFPGVRFIYQSDHIKSEDRGRSAIKGNRWNPSIYMERAAARIYMKIVRIRVENVKDISEPDAKAEGCDPFLIGPDDHGAEQYKQGYERLWDSINIGNKFSDGVFVFAYDIARISEPK